MPTEPPEQSSEIHAGGDYVGHDQQVGGDIIHGDKITTNTHYGSETSKKTSSPSTFPIIAVSLIVGGGIIAALIIGFLMLSQSVGSLNAVTEPQVIAPATITASPVPLEDPTPTELITPPAELTSSTENQENAPLTMTQVGYEFVFVAAAGSSVSRDFWIGRYEVTNAQFVSFLSQSLNRCSENTVCYDLNAGTARIERRDGAYRVIDAQFAAHPVANITWNAAQDYCASIDARLPVPDEWSVAAGWEQPLGQMFNYPWGNASPTVELVNFDGQSTMAVGSYPSGVSPSGVEDMAGNVWEYVDESQGINRLRMGGGYRSPSAELTTTSSTRGQNSLTYPDVGFRCAL